MALGRAGLVCIAMLVGCASDDPAPARSASRGDGGRNLRDHDGSAPAEPTSGRDAGAQRDASRPDADRREPPWPEPPTTDGVHVSVEREPYATADEAFFYETDRPGIQGELPGGATVRVELAETPGTLDCEDGAVIVFEVPEGRLRADAQLGVCEVLIEAYGASSGDLIEASFSATVERISGEVADSLELRGRLRVGHP